MRSVDAQLEMVPEEVDAPGSAGKTIVMFTSDHGEMAGAHGLRGKDFSEVVTIPLPLTCTLFATAFCTPTVASRPSIADLPHRR